MEEQILDIKNEALAQIIDAKSAEEIEHLRIAYLGRSGKLSELTKKIGGLSVDERKRAGRLINEAKETIGGLLSSQKNKAASNTREWFDPTIPGIKPGIGHLHLVTQAIKEIADIFEKIGFVRGRYPEVEYDWYPFGSLNFSEWHPARDDWETFWVDAPEDSKLGPMVLTPHTSSGQIREMQRVGTPPIRMINIAKVYRRQSDPAHLTMLHQFEGLVVDQGITIANLKGTLDYFAKTFFGPGRVSRLRPYDFPFTEPSFEVDIRCDVCGGSGCKLCKEGWLEIGGAGMVHPTVLKNGGIDPLKFTGFAFGWGVERCYLMKSGLKIPDIRDLYSTDLRYLRQY